MARRTSPPPRPRAALDVATLTACRRAYETTTITFGQLAAQHGVAERTMRRLLVAIGVVPRPRGNRPADLPLDLILSDHDGGLSARRIALKHGLGDHHAITTLLRAHGRQPHHRGRGAAGGNRSIVLGTRLTNRHARLRQKTILAIPVRTESERRIRFWTAPERAAIAQAIEAGRITYAPRGRSGLPERLTIAEQSAIGFRFAMAMRRAA